MRSILLSLLVPFQDTLLFYLEENKTHLSQEACATIYRIAPLNRHFQLNGAATDYYLENDTVAARLTYANEKLDGPCTHSLRNKS